MQSKRVVGHHNNRHRYGPRRAVPAPSTDRTNAVIQAVATIAAAFVVAFVAFVSFTGNYTATIQSQKDSQFYEALRRFGDKSEPTVRCSAAALLGQMGAEKTQKKWWGIHRSVDDDYPYFETALNQLYTGSLMENNPIVLRCIADSLEKLADVDNSRVLTHLHVANFSLQEQVVQALTDFLSSRNAEPPRNYLKCKREDILQTAQWQMARVRDIHLVRNGSLWGDGCVWYPRFRASLEFASLTSDDAWQLAAQAADYSPDVLLTLVDRTTWTQQFVRRLRIAEMTRTRMGERPHNFTESETLERLSAASARLRYNSFAYAYAIRNTHDDQPNLLNSFLVGGDVDSVETGSLSLVGAKLHGASFGDSQLQGVDFSDADLSGAWFCGASIQHSTFGKVDLRDANMTGTLLQDNFILRSNLDDVELALARIKHTSLRYCSLRQANFAFADLTEGSLAHSDISGADVDSAQLRRTAFYDVKLNKRTNLSGANWYEADFFDDSGRDNIDSHLLRLLYARYPNGPVQQRRVHPSVWRFVKGHH